MECQDARDDERHKVWWEECQNQKKYWHERYEEDVAEEKKRLQQEMKDILVNWFNIQTEVES